MKIARIEAHHLENIPIEPPPFRELPNVEDALLVEIETTDGIVGWAMGGYMHPLMVDFINRYCAPALVGMDPMFTEGVISRFDKHSGERFLGRGFVSAVSMIDIALWDIKGKALGKPVHHLLGGAREKVPVYITHGAAYAGAPIYSVEELAAEAAHLKGLGNKHLKNTVGRQASPDPDDDCIRMRAIRDAVGPDVTLAMDGNCRMSVSQAVRLCRLTEDLNISFFEEPVFNNDPQLLHELKSKTMVPIAAAENHKFSCRDLLVSDAVDIIQPNVNNDGGYTACIKIAGMAQAFNKPIGHGNGSGPHNIALNAGLRNGGIIEYHYHKWMAYNAIFKSVPQPTNGYLEASKEPGLGLEPKDGLIREFKTKH